MSTNTGNRLEPVAESSSPTSKVEALAFALAMKETRAIDRQASLHDAIYVERLSRLLPTYSLTPKADDDLVLGYWLSGGAQTSAKSFRRLSQMLSWLSQEQLLEIVESAGIAIPQMESGTTAAAPMQTAVRSTRLDRSSAEDAVERVFTLPGRTELELFFREHVIDIVENSARYEALGIGFPGAVVLHGPPGTGKTFAVERLVEFLGWPSYQMDAASLASPYIHETSRKIAAMFDTAIENAPSVLVIDEMEAFLSNREDGSGHHRVEEVGEFLRRIPEAVKNRVLIIAMTNRVDMIDPAILRRGRFDHIQEVGYASYEEVYSLLKSLTDSIATDSDLDLRAIAERLRRRPLSDVSFVIREGARAAVRSGRDRLDQESLLLALTKAPPPDGYAPRKIGFV
ncbi:MAG TPA: ATP-binding protein [Gemmatimonadaceae bacterium]|nr:ATP-binding protein [Gemmatimonadaceae bacterium]